jgi:hypothetical protein
MAPRGRRQRESALLQFKLRHYRFDGPVDIVDCEGLKPFIGHRASIDAIYAF